MKITAESTGEIVTLESGQQARVWHAWTEPIGHEGSQTRVPFVMLVARCAVPEGVDQAPFQAELAALPEAEQISLNESLLRYSRSLRGVIDRRLVT